ncbi:hypothetical protein A2707_04890 [Candidatus Saccharibacteria bacterium RIFCSPHIGHO2_01_FULL_45_15]|nr:MAG: hypothetical protein A2707_04890 [Candidatus Saccharibacteria bacterium RIFCSPHIGHO2_01_FULL_45_15]OGL27915.1 MAG: hypothetical protein A3C39_03885 [Candidatus Saccharibacteria bacterium RIFCSPHIGHO2_02_FULL_46_12]OGL32695.1 MAG: hypothetical protein A3E76_05075 [Candidatus Saccharibacteria bacterium RIFCSPHIGHO2_12_FULL_44_22]
MARLPQPGGDAGNWGSILNDYLVQSHKSDGTIKDNAVTASALAPSSVTSAALASDSVDASTIADGSITETLLATAVQTKLNAPANIVDGSVAKIKLVSSVQASLDKADAALSQAAASNITTGYVSNMGTPVGSPVVIKPTGDARAGVWEYIHNDTAGYLFHLMAGQNTSNGSWLVGVGIDAGLGNGFIFRNKAKGIGLKIEQVSSITSATAYGLNIDQKSNLAPAVYAEQKLTTGGAASLLDLISYETASTSRILKVQGANAKGFSVRSADGILEFGTNVEFNGASARIDARDDSTVPATSRSHVYLDMNGIEFARNSGTANIYYQSRIRQSSTSLIFEASANAALGSASYETILAIGNGGTGAKRLAFFGATPVTKRAGWAVATGTSKRTTFDTSTVTLTELAGVVKALVDDLHSTAGYGLLQS